MLKPHSTKHQSSHKKAQYSLDFRSPKVNNTTYTINFPLFASPNSQVPKLHEGNDDTNKENLNISNIPNKKENKKKMDSLNLLFKDINPLNPNLHGQKSKTPTTMQTNFCSSPKFLGGVTSPSTSGFVGTKGNNNSKVGQEEYMLETRIRPYGDVDSRRQNTRDRYGNTNMNTKPKNINVVNQSKRYENKQGESATLRKSMSLEDLRLAQKVDHPENKSNRNTSEANKLGYAFSFNNKTRTLQEQILESAKEKKQQQEPSTYEQSDDDFMSNISGFINHFEDGEAIMQENKKKGIDDKKISKDESYQSLLRQFRASSQEINNMKIQMEEMREKKDSLISTNNMILQELERHYQKEKIFRNKLSILEGQVLELREESTYYQAKYKEAQRRLKEERIGNENDLLNLKRLLSDNIGNVFGRKAEQSFGYSTAKSKFRPRDTLQSFLGLSSAHRDTKISFDESRGARPAYVPHGERIGSFSKRREEQERHNYERGYEEVYRGNKLNVTSVSSEELEEGYEPLASTQKFHAPYYEPNQESEEEKEHKEVKEEMRGSKLRHSVLEKGLEKEKHIQSLQKKLASLLQSNEPTPLVHSKILDRSQSHSNIKSSVNHYEYDESNEMSKQSHILKRHAGGFIETPISEDVNECSFSLPTSE